MAIPTSAGQRRGIVHAIAGHRDGPTLVPQPFHHGDLVRGQHLGFDFTRDLTRMVEEGRYCIDIMTQLSAARAALRRVEQEVLRDSHRPLCARGDAKRGRAHQDRTIQELIDVLARSRG
jgi:DNA-binding FrmR family transcriptional regulator